MKTKCERCRGPMMPGYSGLCVTCIERSHEGAVTFHGGSGLALERPSKNARKRARREQRGWVQKPRGPRARSRARYAAWERNEAKGGEA